MKLCRIFLFIGFTCVCVCCKRDKHKALPTSIIVDVENSRAVNLDSLRIKQKSIVLENGGSNSLIRYIDNFVIFDTVLLISSDEKLIKFDPNGKFLGNISMHGRAGDEYLGLNGMWNRGDTIYLYDMNGKKIMLYNIGNDLLSVISLSPLSSSNPFQSLIPYKEGYIGKMIYKGTPDISNELAYYDHQCSFKQFIGDTRLTSGITLGYPFSKYGDLILYWRQLENFIYSIDDSFNLTERYYIDFGDKNVPSDKSFKDEYDIIDLINASPDRYASIISRVIESNEYVTFCFLTDGKRHLAVYDKETKVSKLFYFKDDLREIIDLIPMPTGELYVFSSGENDNSVIHRINIYDLVAL